MPAPIRLLAGAALVLAALTACSTSAPPTAPVAKPTPTPSPSDAPPTLAEFLATWDDFDVLVVEGTGNSTIDIPAGLTNGMVTATHDGASYFEVNPVDDTGARAGYPLVTTSGPYRGVTGWGISHTDSIVDTAFEIVADGAWTFRLEPLAHAPIFAPPVDGTGDAVFQYDGAYAETVDDLVELRVTTEGENHFSVAQYFGDRDIELLVNDSGAAEYRVTLEEGPSLFAVHATAPWNVREG